MATTDNKILTGAGVEKLSQLVKSAIAEGGGGTEYTAGQGIEISGENKIGLNTLCQPGETLAVTRAAIEDGPGTIKQAVTSKSQLIEYFNQGYRFFYKQLGVSSFSWTPQELYHAFFGQNTTFYTINNSGEITNTTTYAYNDSIPVEAGFYFIDSVNRVVYFQSGSSVGGMQYLLTRCIPYYNGSSKTTVKAVLDELVASKPNIATTETAGTVIPDGTTITVDSNGVISSQGGSLPSDPLTDGSYKLVNTVATVGGTQTATQSWEEDSGSGGGSGASLPTDPVVDGSYKLVNTVATVEGTQTATQSWEEDTGYTAGPGIKIDDDNNIIYTHNNDIAGLFQILTGLGRGTAESTFRQITTNNKELLKTYLKQKDSCFILGTGNSLTAQEVSELGFTYGVKYSRTTGQRSNWGAYPGY